MCGIVGIVGNQNVAGQLYDGLTVLQHRGQDAAGIATAEGGRFHMHKSSGLASEVFRTRNMRNLQGNWGIGHCRYPTAGSAFNPAEAQPFYVNSPYGITLAHNGNLTNAHEIADDLFRTDLRHINTDSDSEVLLNVLAHELQEQGKLNPNEDDVFSAVSAVHRRCRGAYAVVAMITGYGILGFRDPNGIRPIVYGERDTAEGKEYIIASESVAVTALGFHVVRDLAPGEAVFINQQGQLFTRQCASAPRHTPCIFEYVYFARPDSTIDNISVYKARLRMGEKLANKIRRELGEDHDIDVVMPIPDTSRTAAIELANKLNVKYREGFMKNRYIGRTFIMPGQSQRKKSVRRKLNAISSEFKGKKVLLVDDSIVRGTTSEQIIQMAREAGAAKVYFASAAPEIRFPNVYGIDMPTANELIAHGREVEEVCKLIGADGLIFQDLEDLEEAVREINPELRHFETSVFNGHYVTSDVDQGYLDHLNALRSDDNKAVREWQEGTSNLEIFNEGS